MVGKLWSGVGTAPVSLVGVLVLVLVLVPAPVPVPVLVLVLVLVPADWQMRVSRASARR